MGRTVIAGIGNIFLGDDAFGPAVAERLAAAPPHGVEVVDAGIRGLHLAMSLAEGVDAVVLVDAAELHAEPGTIRLIEPDGIVDQPAPDAHSIDVGSLLGLVRRTCPTPPRIVLVGCQPSTLEPAAPLSPEIAAAVAPAARLAAAVARCLHLDPTDPLDDLTSSLRAVAT